MSDTVHSSATEQPELTTTYNLGSNAYRTRRFFGNLLKVSHDPYIRVHLNHELGLICYDADGFTINGIKYVNKWDLPLPKTLWYDQNKYNHEWWRVQCLFRGCK
jgi:hypothetical protein